MFDCAVLLAAAVLLLVAGWSKLRTPQPAAAMIRRLRPVRAGAGRSPGGRGVVRWVAVIELATAVAVLATAARAAAIALTLCYLVLAIVAVRLATGAERTACGCFGAADGAVGAPHVVLDVAALAAGVWASVRPPGTIAALFEHGPLVGVTACAQAGVLAALGYLSITALPALLGARRSVEVR